MNVENLTQFNSDRFLMLFGLYVRRQRSTFELTLEDLAVSTGIFSASKLAQIEDGLYLLSDLELETLVEKLNLEEVEIMNLAKITQVEEIVEFTKVLNEHFPQ